MSRNSSIGTLSALAAGMIAVSSSAWAGAAGSGSDPATVPNFTAYSAQVQTLNSVATEIAAALTASLNSVSGVKGAIAAANVSGKAGSVSLSVDAAVDAGTGEVIRIRRFIVLRIGLEAALASPKALAVALAGMVGRTLIQEVARELEQRKAPTAVAVKDLGAAMTSMSEDDFSLSAPKS